MDRRIWSAIVSILVLIFICPQLASSQSKDITREEISEFGSFSGMVTTKNATEVTGSPYLTEKFLKGQILINKRTPTKTLYLRFNIHKNQVEFLRNGEIMVTDPKKIYGFRVIPKQGDPILFQKGFQIDDENVTKNSMLRVVRDGKVKFLAHHTSILNEDLASYGTATKKNKYQSFVDYFINTGNGTFEKTKISKKSILEILSDQKEKLVQFAAAEDLTFENEQDLIKILDEYEKLSTN